MATVYARRSAGVGRAKGGVTFVRKGQAYDDSHELVREHPSLFAPEPEEVTGRRGVERATRAPGEKRATPRKRTQS
ncbi:MAG: hypothetical protein ACOC9R_05070 [bacterium]